MNTSIASNLLSGCILQVPTQWPGRVQLLEAASEEQFHLLREMPGVYHYRGNRRKGTPESWYLPQSLVDMGHYPGVLQDYDDEDVSGLTPNLMRCLREHQRKAVAFLRRITPQREGALLGADMGLGKCTISLQALNLDGFLERPGVVVGPLSSAAAWVGPTSDATLHFDMQIKQLEGKKEPDTTQLKGAQHFFINYDILPAWVTWLCANLGPAWVIFDECHLLMHATAQRSESAYKFSHWHTIERRIGLTGTPIPNYRLDLWNQLRCVQPRQWGESKHQFGVRYCHSAGTRVTMGDYTSLPIEQVRVGDEVIGFMHHRDGWIRPRRTKVVEVYSRYAEVWRASLDDGSELLTTKDHQWYQPKVRGKRDGNRLYAPITRVGKRGRQLKRWDWVADPCTLNNIEFAQGWLRGVIDGDGVKRKVAASALLRSKGHNAPTYSSYLAQNVEKNWRVLDRAERFASLVGWRAVRSKPDAQGMARVTFTKLSTVGGRKHYVAKPVYDWLTAEPLTPSTNMFWLGWLSGMYDAEGWGNVISQSEEANPLLYQRLRGVLSQLKIDALPLEDGRGGFRMTGGRDAFVRFVRLCHPAKIEALDAWAPKSLKQEDSLPRVLSFESTGVLARVYNIQTETGNYFAECIASKNCGGKREVAASEDGSDEREYWIYDGETNDLELRARLAGTLLRYTRYDVVGALPDLSRKQVRIDPKPGSLDEYELAERNIVTYLQDKGDLEVGARTVVWGDEEIKLKASEAKPSGIRLRAVSTLIGLLSDLKAREAVADVELSLHDHDHIVVFTWRRASAALIVDELTKLLAQKGTIANKLPVVFGPIDGGMKQKDRQARAQEFATMGSAVYVATLGAAGISINELSAASCVIFSDLHWNPSVLTQAESRIHRDGSSHKEVESHYLVVKDTIDELLIHHLTMKADAAASVSPNDLIGQNLVADLSIDRGMTSEQAVDQICALLAQMEEDDDGPS